MERSRQPSASGQLKRSLRTPEGEDLSQYKSWEKITSPSKWSVKRWMIVFSATLEIDASGPHTRDTRQRQTDEGAEIVQKALEAALSPGPVGLAAAVASPARSVK